MRVMTPFRGYMLLRAVPIYHFSIGSRGDEQAVKANVALGRVRARAHAHSHEIPGVFLLRCQKILNSDDIIIRRKHIEKNIYKMTY